MAKYAVMIHGDFDEFNDYLARSIAGSSLLPVKRTAMNLSVPICAARYRFLSDTALLVLIESV